MRHNQLVFKAGAMRLGGVAFMIALGAFGDFTITRAKKRTKADMKRLRAQQEGAIAAGSAARGHWVFRCSC